MDADIIIKLGDKVQVKAGKNWCSTIVEYVEDDGTFFISPLLSRQKKVELAEGQVYAVNTVNRKGLFEFDALVIKTDITDQNKNVSMTKLLMVTQPRRHQRRNAFRVDVMLDVIIRESADPGMPEEPPPSDRANTLDISESGMLFSAKKNYPPGTILYCDILMNRYGMEATLREVKAEVIRKKPPEFDGTRYLTGVSFIEMNKQDKRTLLKFIMLCQRIEQKKNNRN